MVKKNEGKRFETDFFKSASKVMFIYRLPDPGSSFNLDCQGCKKLKTRFSPKNLCDFFAFSNGVLFLLELKSHAGKSIPFAAIVKNEKDTRLEKMVEHADKWPDIESFIVFNWRDCENKTFAVRAWYVLEFMKYSDRKSIPFAAMEDWYELPHTLKRVRYSYDLDFFVNNKQE